MNASKYKKLDIEIIRLYNTGLSSLKIAKLFKMGEKTVDYRLKINNMRKRSISEANMDKPKSIEHRKHLSENRIRLGLAKGFRNPNWRGGVQDDWSELKNSTEYKLWRKSVFERDNYTCKACGDNKGGNFQAHHLLPRSKFPHLVFSLNNGITLCKKCHEKLYKSTWDIINSDELLGYPTVNSGTISSQAEVKSSEGSTTTGERYISLNNQNLASDTKVKI